MRAYTISDLILQTPEGGPALHFCCYNVDKPLWSSRELFAFRWGVMHLEMCTLQFYLKTRHLILPSSIALSPKWTTFFIYKSSLVILNLRWHFQPHLSGMHSVDKGHLLGGENCYFSFFSTAWNDYYPIKGYFGQGMGAPYGRKLFTVPCGCSFGWITYRHI